MKRRLALLALIVLLTPCVLALCLALGASGVGFPDIRTPAGAAVFDLRLNRILAGFAIGAALSCAGVVLQALLRNPLAEPYVLGVSSGSGLGAALAILTGAAAHGPAAIPVAAFVTGALTLAVVYALAYAGGRLSIYSLILSGVIVSSVCSSLLMFMVSIAPVEGLHNVIWWLLGNLQVESGPVFAVCAGIMTAGMAGIWLLSPELNALCLGSEMAHNVGVRAGAALAAGLLLATLTTSAAVGMAGLIGFVGLIVPHAVRALVGADHRLLVPAAAFAGGMFLAVCDAAARTVLAPQEIPVGVVTSLLGGPFFLAILYRRRRTGWIA